MLGAAAEIGQGDGQDEQGKSDREHAIAERHRPVVIELEFGLRLGASVCDHGAGSCHTGRYAHRETGHLTPEEGALTRKNLVLAAMVFAVAMTFIDQTIVAIAIPNVEKELGLSATESQWVINAYLLALSALFAFGGKLADVVGRRRICVI